MAIRAVFFDALATLVAPRLPIYVQYSQTFEPYLGALDPDLLKKSFKIGKPESRRPSDALLISPNMARAFRPAVALAGVLT